MNPSFKSAFYQIHKFRLLLNRVVRRLFGIDLRSSIIDLDSQGEDANRQIKTSLESGLPLMVTRLGVIEREAVERYLNIKAEGNICLKFWRYLFTGVPFWWDEGIQSAMGNSPGFFPTHEKNLATFADLMLDDLPLIDILGCFLHGAEIRMRRYFSRAVLIPLKDIEPYYHSSPWSQALAGKRVLVIHPFETSIRSQYARRQHLFRDPKVLPQFELLTLKAVQSIAGNPVEFETWFDALDWMCNQINGLDFDVALIGAGAYGLPLAAFVKRMGKAAIHLGGATQILFGIRGKRWDQWPFFQSLYNEYWVRPLPEEVPEQSQTVESGAYW